MKKILFFSLILLFFSIKSFSQEWHSVTDTLRLPNNNSKFQTTNGFLNHLDTVMCKYKTDNNSLILTGYKLVYVYDGFYTDTQETVNVFFDAKRERVYNVKMFAVN